MSERFAEVVRIGEVRKHENADSLSITTILGSYPVVFRTGSLNPNDLAVYVSVDMCVPTSHPAFAFLGKHSRIKAKRLRGIFSMGLCLPLSDFPEFKSQQVKVGDDVTDILGIKPYEAPDDRADKPAGALPKTDLYETLTWGISAAVSGAAFALMHSAVIATVFTVLSIFVAWHYIDRRRHANKPPRYPVYDLEGMRKHTGIFNENEDVYVSEKLHGMNASYMHNGVRLHVRSRTVHRHDKTDAFWKIARKYDLERKLAKFPNLVLFGEVYGRNVQDLSYGKQDIEFAAFDAGWLGKNGQLTYLSVRDFLSLCRLIEVPYAPPLYVGPYCEEIRELAEGQSCVEGANHVREGIVIKSMVEETHPRIGRKILKLAGQGYLLR